MSYVLCLMYLSGTECIVPVEESKFFFWSLGQPASSWLSPSPWHITSSTTTGRVLPTTTFTLHLTSPSLSSLWSLIPFYSPSTSSLGERTIAPMKPVISGFLPSLCFDARSLIFQLWSLELSSSSWLYQVSFFDMHSDSLRSFKYLARFWAFQIICKVLVSDLSWAVRGVIRGLSERGCLSI